MRLLLVSNSTLFGSSYLEHCSGNIKAFLGEKPRNILFFPYALADHDEYAKKAQEAFESFGHSLHSIHKAEDKIKAVNEAEVCKSLKVRNDLLINNKGHFYRRRKYISPSQSII